MIIPVNSKIEFCATFTVWVAFETLFYSYWEFSRKMFTCNSNKKFDQKIVGFYNWKVDITHNQLLYLNKNNFYMFCLACVCEGTQIHETFL